MIDLLVCLSLTPLLFSQVEARWALEEAAAQVPEISPVSTDLLDPAGYTRFHLVTRGLFSDGQSVFSGASAWSYEARAHVRLTEGVAITGVLPVAFTTGRRDQGTEVGLGNVALGVTVGAELSNLATGLRVAGGLDAYLPTSPALEVSGLARSTVAAIRGYEMQLYLPRTVAGRLRGLAELRRDAFSVGLELGFVPLASLDRRQQGSALLVSATGRVSARASATVEPYLEVGGATQLSGDGELRPPLLVTPGVRLHLAEAFDPALFVSFNFVAAPAVLFGIDLASVVRPSKRAADRESVEDDFLERVRFMND